MQILLQVLLILCKIKLLSVAGAKEVPTSHESMNASTTIKLNHDYKNKKLRININVPIRSQVKEDDERTLRTIDDDRKYIIEVRLFFNKINLIFIKYFC